MKYKPYPAYKDSGVDWLPSIPMDWSTLPLRYAANSDDSVFIDGDWIESKDISDDGVRYITTGNVGEGIYKEQGTGHITEETFTALNCTEVKPGDVLISRLNIPIGRSCLIPDLGSKIVTSVDNVIVRPASHVVSSYLVYLLTAKEYFAHTEMLARGTTMQRISRTILGNIRVCLPSVHEQSTIATFLDRETAKLDTLIAKQIKLIELLQEKRQALISHAVTKGLDPYVEMKDSGIEWLGRVPEHWDVIRLGALFYEVNDAGNEELPILRVSIHDGVSDREFDDEELDRKVTRSEDRSKYKCVLPGDLVYNMMRAWQGGFGAVVVPGMVSPAYVVARPRINLSTEYVEQRLRTPQAIENLRLYSRGVTDFRLRLYWDEFKSLKIAIPPIDEQKQIMLAVGIEVAKLDTLIEKSRRSIELMREHRTALISAAVTGRIDVREAA